MDFTNSFSTEFKDGILAMSSFVEENITKNEIRMEMTSAT